MKRMVVALVVCVAMVGCTPDWAKQSEAPVIMRILAMNGGDVMQSDVFDSSANTVTGDEIAVAVAVRSTNLRVAVPQVSMAVFLERYEVRYVRSDGRAIEGVDVPYRITGNLVAVIDAETTGGEDVVVEVVRAQAKMEPPLRNLLSGGGMVIFTVFADVTLHGKTVAGEAVTASARMQIDFADYGN